MNRDGFAAVGDAPLVLERAEYDDLRAAAREGWQILKRATHLALAMDDAALIGMGIPPITLAAVRRSHAPAATFARFDCIRTPAGYKIIECNADTPFLLLEAHRRCALVLTAHGYADPNTGLDAALGRTLAAAFHAAVSSSDAAFAITAYDVAEDRATAELLAELTAPHLDRPLRIASLASLRIRDGALVDERGRIDVLLRLYPLEWMARDRAGPAFFDALAADRVRSINAPVALLMQNKLIHALIWQMAEHGAYFTPDECAVIRARFLPGSAERPAGGRWFIKPAFGREGFGVRFDDGRFDPIVPSLWQAALDPPFVRCGSAAGLAVASCFIIGGEPGAVVMRVGGAVTDPTAHVVPLAVSPNG